MYIAQPLAAAGSLDTLASNLLATQTVERILRNLRQSGITPPIALKGFALLHTLYRNTPGMRPMVDIDFLVHPGHEGLVEGVLEEQGFRRTASGQPCWVMKRGATTVRIDIETAIWYLDGPGLHGFRARATSVPLGRETLFVPCAEDHMLHVACHAVLRHGQLRPVWLEDMRRLTLEGIDWRILAGRARAALCETPLVLSLNALDEYAPGTIPARAPTRLGLLPRARWRAGFLRWLLGRREISDIGHLLRFLFPPRGMTRLRLVREHLFPDTRFLARRYEAREDGDAGVPLRLRWLRPFRAAGRACRLVARILRAPRIQIIPGASRVAEIPVARSVAS